MKVVIDGVEYVPRAEVPELADERLKQCLESLIEIQYLESGQLTCRGSTQSLSKLTSMSCLSVLR